MLRALTRETCLSRRVERRAVQLAGELFRADGETLRRRDTQRVRAQRGPDGRRSHPAAAHPHAYSPRGRSQRARRARRRARAVLDPCFRTLLSGEILAVFRKWLRRNAKTTAAAESIRFHCM